MTTVYDSGSPFLDDRLDAIVRAGGAGTLRYGTQPGDWRELTVAELERTWRRGLAVGLIDEVNRGERLPLGAAAGAADGRRFRPVADRLGWPTWRPIYCAQDEDMPESAYPAGLAYVLAHAHETGRLPGVYGESGFCAYCEERGVLFSWDTSAKAWSAKVNWRRELEQHFNPRPAIPGTDENTVWATDWGGWRPGMLPDWSDMASVTLEQLQQEQMNQDARLGLAFAALHLKLDKVLLQLDPVGVAAGHVSEGPAYLRTEVTAIRTKLGAELPPAP